MGDMAEWAISNGLDDEEFLLSDPSQIEMYEYGLVDELGYLLPRRTPRTKTCRCCGTAGLVWKSLNNKWRLFNSNELHSCPVNPLLEG